MRTMMMSLIFFVFWLTPCCSAFLLDTNTKGQSGNGLNEDRYDALLKLFMDERGARLQLQQYVIQQQQKIDALPDKIEKFVNITNKFVDFENTSSSIDEKLFKLERQYKTLQQRQIEFENKLHASENHTLQLEEELSSLKQVKSINQLQNLVHLQQLVEKMQLGVNFLRAMSQARGQDITSMYKDLTVNIKKVATLEYVQKQLNAKTINQLQIVSNLQQLVQTMQIDVNSLSVTSQARGQDMTSMYKDLTLNNQKLTTLEDGQTKLTVNISILGTTLNDNLTVFERIVYQNMTRTIGSALENQNLMVNSTLEEIIKRNIHVGFTAFGRSHSHQQPAHLLKFPDIKSSFGLTDLSTFTSSGIFTCEKCGIYLISVTVMACADSKDARYDIYKNNISLMHYYVNDSGCNSGSGTIFIRLNVNDTVYVKTYSSINYVYYNWSSLSILKVA